ncbi:uncharacterized protein H6S33_008984 [Morchella sextelata]|uniref:uncharacterized protein n=1 Tax=Morchella sextelata TaxID=1174677 RepID=UPI001D055D34|nr:uncharacterized protein H6S33_008984 [Morchella sextelata]KAH0612604.1 hypothetical protein H6S33_008984 [Morchella sextelata]
MVPRHMAIGGANETIRFAIFGRVVIDTHTSFQRFPAALSQSHKPLNGSESSVVADSSIRATNCEIISRHVCRMISITTRVESTNMSLP